LTTFGSSIQATTFTGPGHSRHVSISMLKTRLSRCAHVIDARRSVGVGGSSPTHALHLLARFGGVTSARCLLFGANTPWKRVKFTQGLGTRLASLAMKSSGSKITWRGAVPVPRLQPVTVVAIGGHRQTLFLHCGP
jgi:hypothetical protein